MMPNKAEVAGLQALDMEKYGNPDGPTFEQLVAKAQKGGLTGDDAYEEVIRKSYQLSEEYNAKFNIPGRPSQGTP